MKIGRNELCKCGSGKKYKKCCSKKEKDTTTKEQMFTPSFDYLDENIQNKDEYNSIQEIFDEIKSKGRVPFVMHETEKDEEWDLPPGIEIGSLCKHGALEYGTEFNVENGKYIVMEGGDYGFDTCCFLCQVEKEGIIPYCHNCKTEYPELKEEEILNLYQNGIDPAYTICKNCNETFFKFNE